MFFLCGFVFVLLFCFLRENKFWASLRLVDRREKELKERVKSVWPYSVAVALGLSPHRLHGNCLHGVTPLRDRSVN